MESQKIRLLTKNKEKLKKKKGKQGERKGENLSDFEEAEGDTQAFNPFKRSAGMNNTLHML